MSRKTPFNLKKFQEIQEQQIQQYRDLARKTHDPAIRDLCKYTVRDMLAANQIHIRRLKFKTS